jgi:RNA polymerase sigma-70 factor (ECF subfamily)
MPRTHDEYVCEILRLEKVLRAYLHRFAPQQADLDDLLQETYSHLFGLSAERRGEVRNIQAFAIASARNVALSWLRQRQVVLIDSVEELEAMPAASDPAGLEDIVHIHQQLVRLAEGIARLPTRCRQIFTLRRVYGWSQKEIANELNIAEGTVEQQLIKGMRYCVQWLDDSAGTSDRKRDVGWLTRWRKQAPKEDEQG